MNVDEEPILNNDETLDSEKVTNIEFFDLLLNL
jgi:hypothetical protein